MGKLGFLTETGLYYEAASKIGASDKQVALRQAEHEPSDPSEQASFDFQQSTQHSTPRPSPHRVRDIIQHVSDRAEATSYKLDEDTQFKFKLKDVIVVVAFIVSIAISWNNADTRMTRHEEKITNLQGAFSEFSKRTDDELRRREERYSQVIDKINAVERSTYANTRAREK